MEVMLWSNKREREMKENFSELFAIIKATTETLEKAYIRNIISSSDYELECQKLVVAECVQNFIAAMDSLKLNMVAVDQVHPLLSDLSSSLNKLLILHLDFEGKIKMKEWIGRLGAADELTEQQARQLHFDLESSYYSFMAALPNSGT